MASVFVSRISGMERRKEPPITPWAVFLGRRAFVAQSPGERKSVKPTLTGDESSREIYLDHSLRTLLALSNLSFP
jgi:hypothetical protein